MRIEKNLVLEQIFNRSEIVNHANHRDRHLMDLRKIICTILFMFAIFTNVLSQTKTVTQAQVDNWYNQGCNAYRARRYTEAIKWMKKAAEYGDTAAICHVGELYYKGLGTEKDYDEATTWFQLASQLGCSKATKWLRYIGYTWSELADSAFNSGDYLNAMQWATKGSDLGDPRAPYRIAVMYHKGTGVEQSYTDASKWYRKSAERGHSAAQYLLSMMYVAGDGVESNPKMEFFWLSKAAENGNENALELLATLHEAKDDEVGLLMLEYAAKEDLPAALFKLGYYYFQHEQEMNAFPLILQSANAGNMDAQFLLGIMYSTGKGTEKDYAMALTWLDKAAVQGDKRAIETGGKVVQMILLQERLNQNIQNIREILERHPEWKK
ncbi:MAG: SEL1-like repeat protein [Bacteroidaceae bacterium]|nr:SEL1-like repeat protein [Bacteroidaceae bacterium]